MMIGERRRDDGLKEVPTPELRFVKRHWDDGTHRGHQLILQQRWIIGASGDRIETAMSEWRDVPVGEEDPPRWLDGTPMRREH